MNLSFPSYTTLTVSSIKTNTSFSFLTLKTNNIDRPTSISKASFSANTNNAKCRYQSELVSGDVTNIESEEISGCKACGREEIEKGCNGEGRIQGGIATVPGFGWWPIKAFRPCPSLVSSGGRYRRRGQSMDEVASGESKKIKKIIPKEINDEKQPKNDETQSRKKTKMGVEKQVLRAGTGPKTVNGQSVTVHCTGFGKNGDISKKFWSTKDWGQQPFTFEIGQGSVIKGWDEGVLGMQVGEVARLRCSPDFAYGAAGFKAWGILPNSVLDFEIELLSVK